MDSSSRTIKWKIDIVEGLVIESIIVNKNSNNFQVDTEYRRIYFKAA
jgi:hypothetical protein